MITVLERDYWVDFFVDSPHMMDGEYGLQHRQRVFILGLRKEEFHKPLFCPKEIEEHNGKRRNVLGKFLMNYQLVLKRQRMSIYPKEGQ